MAVAQASTEPARRSESSGGGAARTLRVLLLAEACNPDWSSVPLVGYNFARALAGHPGLDVTLVTNARNRPAIESDPHLRGAAVHYIDNEVIAGPAFRLGRFLRRGQEAAWSVNTALSWPSYMIFERLVLRRFGADLRRGRFDLIHRVTPVTPVLGSPLACWTDVPMVIGPLNGGLPWPAEFPELRKREREWLIPLRGLHRWLPFHRSTFRRAAGVIVASRQTASELPLGRGHRLDLPENGVDPGRFPIATSWRPPEGPFRFITVGRLAPVKAIDLILRALGGSDPLRGCRLTIVGDGPDRPKLEALTDALGLRDAVEFTGWLDQPRLASRLGESQAFVFPSVKDFGGGAVLEAMASALPSIVTDYGGPGELVTPETGIRLPLRSAARLVDSLRSAMVRLAADPVLCRSLGEAASRRVRERFTWSAKAERLVEFYREVLGLPAATRPQPDGR